jgi:hypothetical protein
MVSRSVPVIHDGELPCSWKEGLGITIGDGHKRLEILAAELEPKDGVGCRLCYSREVDGTVDTDVGGRVVDGMRKVQPREIERRGGKRVIEDDGGGAEEEEEGKRDELQYTGSRQDVSRDAL